MTLFTILLLALGTPALAGEPDTLSDAIGDGHTPIIYGEVLDTQCESYAVDEYGNLLSRFVSEFTIWEVIQVGEGGEILVEGDTVALSWSRFRWGIDGGGGCENPRWSALPQEVKPVPLSIDDGTIRVDPWYEGTADFETQDGVGELPACGEDLQQEVMDELRSGDVEDSGEPASSSDEGEVEPPEDEGEPGPTGDSDKGGCSVAGGSAAGPVLWGLLLLGMGRRRRS
ncbi:MAG TPA: hypothetical protein DFR83_28670 [Deltaproteobacteria bacterium]|nr:hypothetical protein [Deltaproteobacteria bacterium]